jgi:preprotein translocase subunit SecA
MSRSAPLQADLALWSTLRIRRHRYEPLQGLDGVANRIRTRIKHSRIGFSYLKREAEAVCDVEKMWSDLTDTALDNRMKEIREIFARHNQTKIDVRHAFCAVREVAFRETGERPYMVQIMGAMGLYHGQIVEMVTGEGKTLTASIAASVLGWLRRPVHVITVNDYLAQRDADGKQPIYRRCGLHAVAIIGETPEPERAQNYRQPIVYITQKELVADWLRDQLKLGRIQDPVSTRWLAEAQLHNTASGRGSRQMTLVPGLHVAVVDEVDAVLIDEAVTPLIIAQPRQEDAQSGLYKRARELALQLKKGDDFEIEHAKKHCELTTGGRDKLESMLRPDEHAIWRATRRREELVEQALAAEHCYGFRQQYHIVEDKIVIVDEYTGRFMADRTWQHGLHQAVEAKHGLQVTADRDTLASLSFQRFFKLYPHLCGMTGTAADAKAEMETTYGLPVRIIPTNRPLRRTRMPDLIFATMELKFAAVLAEIEGMHKLGRPVLVGTRSIEASEVLGDMLTAKGLEHQVLNASHHKAEAQIVSKAGEPGAIMVATNMAGRGTDIKLGPGVAERGGLHVILTERHTASRVDRQLFGRSGRQGDPGSARCIVCIEDELIIKHAPSAGKALRKMFAGRIQPLPKWVMKAFDHGQRKAQNEAFHSRKMVLRHDEELDKSLPQ